MLKEPGSHLLLGSSGGLGLQAVFQNLLRGFPLPLPAQHWITSCQITTHGECCGGADSWRMASGRRPAGAPVVFTKPSDREESVSGGGVSVSTAPTGASWEFSTDGILSSDWVGATSSGGGVCISGTNFKDGCWWASLSRARSDVVETGGTTWENTFPGSREHRSCEIRPTLLPFQASGETFWLSSLWRRSDHILRSTRSASCWVFLHACGLIKH